MHRHITGRHRRNTRYHCTVFGCEFSIEGGSALVRKDDWTRHLTRLHNMDPDNLPDPILIEMQPDGKRSRGFVFIQDHAGDEDGAAAMPAPAAGIDSESSRPETAASRPTLPAPTVAHDSVVEFLVRKATQDFEFGSLLHAWADRNLESSQLNRLMTIIKHSYDDFRANLRNNDDIMPPSILIADNELVTRLVDGYVDFVSRMTQTSDEELEHNLPKPSDANLASGLDPSKLDFARLLYDFSGASSAELSVRAGDLVAILSRSGPNNEPSEWWYCRTRDGRLGYLPSNYIEILKRPSNSQVPSVSNAIKPQKLRAAIPDEGMSISQLTELFSTQIGEGSDQMTMPQFLDLLKKHCIWRGQLLFRSPASEAGESVEDSTDEPDLAISQPQSPMAVSSSSNRNTGSPKQPDQEQPLSNPGVTSLEQIHAGSVPPATMLTVHPKDTMLRFQEGDDFPLFPDPSPEYDQLMNDLFPVSPRIASEANNARSKVSRDASTLAHIKGKQTKSDRQGSPISNSPGVNPLSPMPSFSSDTSNRPASPPGAQHGSTQAPKTCTKCLTQTTPLWRKDTEGQTLCNPCGLFLQLHGRTRPLTLKADVIKARMWTPEEDALIVELRDSGMKWQNISERLPGRSAISCRLHFQNYLDMRHLCGCGRRFRTQSELGNHVSTPGECPKEGVLQDVSNPCDRCILVSVEPQEPATKRSAFS